MSAHRVRISDALRIPRRAAIALIAFYRKFLSPLKGRPVCRFYPSCSSYAIKAIEDWGLIRGVGMTLWRLCRCQPFSRGGYDFVCPYHTRPDRKLRQEFLSKRPAERYFMPQSRDAVLPDEGCGTHRGKRDIP